MAMMFQRAPPEVAGFGSITSTSGLVEVVEALDVLGVARADHEVTTELVTMPLYWFWFQSVGDDAGVDQARHVGLEREVDHVGRLAGLDRAALVAGRAERVRELDALAVRGLVEGGLEALLVGLLWGRVRHQAERAAARATRGDADDGSEGERCDAETGKEPSRQALCLLLIHKGVL